MKGKSLFLKWALFVTLIAIGAIISANLGWAGYMGNDPSHITYVTLGVFFLATAWCGRQCWKLVGGHDPEEIQIDLKHSWFAVGLCVSIGLIGTAVGYQMMLKHGVAGGDSGEVMRRTFYHASIAIINTIFGGVCAVLVEIQAHFISHAAEKMLWRAGKPLKEDVS